MATFLLRVTALTLAASVTACSILDPDRWSPDFSAGIDQKERPSLFHASRNATNLYNIYDKGRTEMGLFSFYSGSALLGLGLAGLGMALFQAPNNGLFGVGLAAAGIGGLRAFVPFDARLQIYARGQKAILCSFSALSLDAELTINAPDTNHDESTIREQKPQVAPFFTQLKQIIDTLEATKPRLRTEDRDVAFQAGALESATETLIDQLKRISSLSDPERARLLNMALVAIDLAVRDQIDRSDIDPDRALKAAGSTVGPWVGNNADAALAAREQARKLGNQASNLKRTLRSGRDSEVQAAETIKTAADQADAVLQQIWRLTRLPSECSNGFAGASQQASPPEAGSR